MQITGRNLELVRDALWGALADVHNAIATCPDVVAYADDIEEHEKERQEYLRILARVQAAVDKESK
jgi:hypothetical protein